jgi:T5SS/PEP-CTERM-associated repeat protein
MRKTRRRVLAVSMAALGYAAPPAHAIDRFWATFASGNFTDTTKWVGGAIPGSGDAAIFRVFGSGAGPYSVTFPGHTIVQGPANYSTDTLTVGSNTVTFLQSSQLNLTSSTYTLGTAFYLGDSSQPSILTSRLSSFSTPIASVGHVAGGSATLNINAGSFNVTGSGSDFQLKVGDASTGTLNINSGAQMNVTVAPVFGQLGAVAVGAGGGVFGTINVTGAGAVWNNTSDDGNSKTMIGYLGNGSLNITAGGQMNNYDCTVGYFAGSTGAVAVSGANSVWTNRDALSVGEAGSGALIISDGGKVTCQSGGLGEDGGSGTVQVIGAGSLWSQDGTFSLGSIVSSITTGSGVMMISNGGNVNTGLAAYVGYYGSGTASITGSGSKWTIAGDLIVANTGTLTIADSGAVTSNTGQINGRLNLSGGASLSVNDVLQISQSDSISTVDIKSGAKVSSNATVIANVASGYTTTVNLDGAGSIWDAKNQFIVGFAGPATFQVTNGAKVTNDQTQLGTGANSSGVVVVDGAGSSWTTANSMDVGLVGTGNLVASNGGVVTVNGPFTIGSKGTVEGNSIIAANVHNGGMVVPQNGTLQINGSYTQTASGTLRVQLLLPATPDSLSVSGDATLAGALQVDTSGGLTVAGDRYTVLTAAHRTGVFATVVATNAASIQLVPIYSPTDVVILATGVGEKTWGIDASGNSSLPSNWIGGAPGAIDDKVAFSTFVTAPRTVTVDTSFTAGSIYFDGGNSYLVQGPGVITLDVSGSNNASLTVKNLHGVATHTISAPLNFNDSTTIDVAALGTLRITQPITAAPGIAITKTGAGTLAVKNVRADGLTVSAGTVQIMPGGGAAGTSVVKSLTISPTAALDLNNNDLLVDYSGSVSPYGTIRGYLLSGLNSGTAGIISTSAQSAHNTIDALVDNAHLHRTVWNGLPVDDTTIIAKYTLRGDANLDGSVGFADLVTVAQNYGNSSGQATWDIGDFNYDGNVGFADLVALAQNYGGALPAASMPGVSDGFDRDMEAAFASVPEPATLCVALAGCALMGRKRRSRLEGS